MKKRIKTIKENDHFVTHFFDDFSLIVSRFLKSTLNTYAQMDSEFPSLISSSSKLSINDVWIKQQLFTVNLMIHLINEAKPQLKADKENVDFSTESAIFLFRLRFLLEKNLNISPKLPFVASPPLNKASYSSDKYNLKKNLQNKNNPRTISRSRILRGVNQSTNLSLEKLNLLENLKRNKNTVDAECQTYSIQIPINSYHNSSSCSNSLIPEVNEKVFSLSISKGRLAFFLQQHTYESIIFLDNNIENSERNSKRIPEIYLAIQTSYVDGITKELKREKKKIDNELNYEKIIIGELKFLYYNEIIDVLDRLKMAIASLEYTNVIEEVGNNDKICNIENGRNSNGSTNSNSKSISINSSRISKSDLINTFSQARAGFVSKLVIQNVQCFLSVLTRTGGPLQRWVYLEKIIFLIDSSSPVPTIPMERNSTPSHSSTDMNLDKNSSLERSKSIKMDDNKDEWILNNKSLVISKPEYGEQLKGLIQKFQPSQVYEKVRLLGSKFEVKDIW